MRPSLPAALLLVSSLAFGTAANASVDEKKVAASQKAVADFLKLGKDSHKTGKPPRQTDPAVKALLDKALDTSALGTPAEFADLPKMNEWMISGVKVGLIYMLAGTGTNDIMKAAVDEKAIARINRNIVEFDAEYGRYNDFQLILSSFILDAVQAKMATVTKAELDNPKFQAGLAQIGGGVAQTLAGVLSTFVTEGVTDEWQRARLAPLAALAPKAARTLPKEMVEKVREVALQVSDAVTDPQVKDGVKSIADSLVK